MARRRVNPFGAVTPCDDCPFRRQGGIRLRPRRAADIAAMMLAHDGESFLCHKTTGGHRSGDRVRVWYGDEVHCAGALIFATKQDAATQAMRFAIGLGIFDPTRLDLAADVFDDVDEMIRANVVEEERGRASDAHADRHRGR